MKRKLDFEKESDEDTERSMTISDKSFSDMQILSGEEQFVTLEEYAVGDFVLVKCTGKKINKIFYWGNNRPRLQR